jgi:hypothetical protein
VVCGDDDVEKGEGTCKVEHKGWFPHEVVYWDDAVRRVSDERTTGHLDSLEKTNENPEASENPASRVTDAVVPHLVVIVVVVDDGVV